MSYDPNIVPEDREDWRRFLQDELERIRNGFDQLRTELLNADFMLRVSRGLIPGYSSVNKYGRNTSIAAGTRETVWDGSTLYNVTPSFPTTAVITRIVSTSAADTGRSCRVIGLDINWNEVSQDIAMTGTTPVVLTTPLLRCYRMYWLSTTGPTGTINCTDTAGTTVYAIIQPGVRQTQMAVYTVPIGYKAYMTKMYGTINRASGGGGSSPDGVFDIVTRDNASNGTFLRKITLGCDLNGNSQIDHEWLPYREISGQSDILMQVENTGTGTLDVSGGFDLILVQDGY